jgi:hypothetical protein
MMMRFIHIPKNAGTTVGKMLGRNGIEFMVGMDGQQHTRHRYARDFCDGFDSFAVVRNPYTRAVSWFEWIRRMPKYADLEFDDFVLNRFNSGRARLAWTPQTEWTHTALHETQLVTHILRYETLERDLKALFPAIGGKWLHLNSGGIVDYDAYYTEQTRRAVTESFSEDFINFGYPTK